jgi:hypothetical protein
MRLAGCRLRDGSTLHMAIGMPLLIISGYGFARLLPRSSTAPNHALAFIKQSGLLGFLAFPVLNPLLSRNPHDPLRVITDVTIHPIMNQLVDCNLVVHCVRNYCHAQRMSLMHDLFGDKGLISRSTD